MKLAATILSMLLATLALGGVTVADSPYGCSASATTPTCEFHCHAGRAFYVQLFGDVGVYVAGSGTCGGITVDCAGTGLGGLSETGVVCKGTALSSTTGTCTYEAGDFVWCGELIIR